MFFFFFFFAFCYVVSKVFKLVTSLSLCSCYGAVDCCQFVAVVAHFFVVVFACYSVVTGGFFQLFSGPASGNSKVAAQLS